VFSNLSWYEVAVLLLVALFIFGDKLPKAVADGLRMLRNLRRMAQDATTDLSRELGTDVRIEDLHPRSFIRKHLLSEADQEALVKPIKGVSDDLKGQTRGLRDDLTEVGRNADRVAGRRAGGRGGQSRPRATPESLAAPPATGPATSPAPPRYDDIT
jgi:sec-independent protein translocase protein TatB